jgi:hypothetical protein
MKTSKGVGWECHGVTDEIERRIRTSAVNLKGQRAELVLGSFPKAR